MVRDCFTTILHDLCCPFVQRFIAHLHFTKTSIGLPQEALTRSPCNSLASFVSFIMSYHAFVQHASAQNVIYQKALGRPGAMYLLMPAWHNIQASTLPI